MRASLGAGSTQSVFATRFVFLLSVLLSNNVPPAAGWGFSQLQEKFTLIDLQQTASTTTSSDWDNGWDHAGSPCDGAAAWPGVRCNSAGYVSHLYLGNSDLGGRLSDRFFFFRDLEQLFVDHNDITNELPASIGSLSHLTTLDVSSNHFVGTIPASWGSLRNLRNLVLRDNPELTGQIPVSLLTEEMQSLRIELSGTQLSDGVIAEGGSSGNAGTVPYKASLVEGSATTYPRQTRRVNGVGRSLYRSAL